MILLISSEFDPHTDSVIYALRELGEYDFLRLDLETAQDNFDFHISIANQSMPTWSISSKADPILTVNSRNIKAFWWRRSTAYFNSSHLNLPSIETIDKVESYWMLRLLVESLDSKYFTLGHPFVMRNADNKVKQLFTAINCGFTIPSTLLTNNAVSLNGFLECKKEVIIKPIKSSIVTTENSKEISLKTSVNKSEILQQQLNEVTDFSLFTQSNIDKIADIRVTVLNKTIIACKIDTSTLPPFEVDWRPNTFDFDHTIIELPKMLEFSIFRYLEAMNIRSGYFDFGLDSLNNFWFIECNPNAQWFWIELKTGFKISFEIAKQLLATKQSNN
jgi:hypothetical protein